MNLTQRFDKARRDRPCGCGQAIGAGGDHTVELHERHEARKAQRPSWLDRAGKDLTGAVRA